MVVATTGHRATSPRARRLGGLLPEPQPRVGAYGYAGKGVRDDVREGIAVIGFSAGASVCLAILLTLTTRLAG